MEDFNPVNFNQTWFPMHQNFPRAFAGPIVSLDHIQGGDRTVPELSTWDCTEPCWWVRRLGFDFGLDISPLIPNFLTCVLSDLALLNPQGNGFGRGEGELKCRRQHFTHAEVASL